MEIKISGIHINLDEDLKNYVEEHLKNHVNKYFDTAIASSVNFSKQVNNFNVTIMINEGVKNGIVIKSDGSNPDIYVAFNQTLEKSASQLRKYKDKIKNYRRQQGGLKNFEINEKVYNSIKYTISETSYPLLKEIEEEEEGEFSLKNNKENKFKIISQKITEIEHLNVDDAIMKMDLTNLPALVFINSANNRLNVIYHRKDNNISWIDTGVGA